MIKVLTENASVASKALVVLMASMGLAACNSSGDGSNVSNTLEINQQDQAASVPQDRSNDLRAFCPKTVIRAGTETYRTFANGVKKDDPDALNSLEFQATVSDTVRECNYSVNNLNIRVGIRGRVINGPTGATGTINVPIRVAAVTTVREVLYSQLHQVSVTIPEGSTRALFSFVDSNINIPVPEKPNVVIYVGFDEGPPEGAQSAQTQ